MCRICKGPEPERLDITACIDRGESDRKIASKSRHSRMGVWRFRQHLREQRAEAEKATRDARLKKFQTPGKIVIEWPAGEFTLDGQPFDLLRDFDPKADTLVVVECDKPTPRALANIAARDAKQESEPSPESPEVVTETGRVES